MDIKILFIIAIGILVFTSVYMYFDSKKYRKEFSKFEKRIIDDRKYKDIIEYAISHMDGYEFEDFIEKLFKLSGVRTKKTPSSRDFGKDIILKTAEGICYVECKCYGRRNKISSEKINKLIGSCTADGVDKALFITTSSYTNDALTVINNANKNGMNIENWDTDDILKLCLKVDKIKVLDYLDLSI